MIPAHTPPHSFHELLKATYTLFNNRNVKEEFECKIKNHLHTNRYFTTISGRRALYIGLKCLGICKGDEIILPAFTTDIVPMVVRETGAIPIPVDVRLEDYNIDTDLVLNRISNKTKAILTVHTFGCPSDLKALKDICDEYNIFLIEDAAPAFGAKYHGKPVGTFGDIGIFSFGVGKSISMGTGGGIIAQNEDLFRQIMDYIPKQHKNSGIIFSKIMGSILLSDPLLYGIVGCRIKDMIVSNQYGHYSEEILDEQDISLLSYSIGIQQMKSDIYERRREIALEYSVILKNFNRIYPPVEKGDIHSVYSRYFIRVESEEIRNNICERMKKSGIEPLIPDHGYPISTSLYPIGFQDGIPNAKILSKTLIGIPVNTRVPQNILKEIFQL